MPTFAPLNVIHVCHKYSMSVILRRERHILFSALSLVSFNNVGTDYCQLSGLPSLVKLLDE